MKCILWAVWLWSSIAGATTYYVSSSGDDTHSGLTIETAWATIQHAADRIQAGDTVEVASGTYAGAHLEGAGTAEAPITLKAMDRARVLLNRPGPDDAQKHHASILLLERWDGKLNPAYWIIEGFEIVDAPYCGIDIRGSASTHAHHITLRHNRILHSEVSGIFTAFVDDMLIEDCETLNSVQEHGIYCSNSGDRPVIRKNRSHHNRACGIQINADAKAGGDGIISDALIEANTLYANGQAGGSAINLDGVINTVIRNNLVYDNLSHGISLFRINGAKAPRNCRILHNTILVPAARGATGDGWAINISHDESSDNEITGNILLNAHRKQGSVRITAAARRGIRSNHNVICGRFGISRGFSTDLLRTFSWRAQGYDLNSIEATPETLFIDPANFDFRLKPQSPALDAGSPQTVVDVDIVGTHRPQGPASDPGAYERPVDSIPKDSNATRTP